VIKNQAEQATPKAKTWYERAELALKRKGEEDLAAEALAVRKLYQDTATARHRPAQNSQSGQVETPQKSWLALEGKIAPGQNQKGH